MILNNLEKTIQIKIVYYGPALSGKTTSMKSLFKYFANDNKVLSIESSIGRTLFFDYGKIMLNDAPWNLKLHIYSTTGQDFYIVTRPTTLKGMDCLIFVADSQKDTYARNIISWNELKTYFSKTFMDIPIVLCFNKQDIPEKFNENKFLEEVDFAQYKNIDLEHTIATTGAGILESFEKVLTLFFKNMPVY